jgi:hypothetical protein
MDSSNLPVLTDWELEPGYSAELGSVCYVLTGTISNDSRFPDGRRIITSRVVVLDNESGIARTRNTLYKLGKHK